MTRKALGQAFFCWAMAVREKIIEDITPESSLQDIALQFGDRTSTPENIEIAGEIINYDALIQLIERCDND